MNEFRTVVTRVPRLTAFAVLALLACLARPAAGQDSPAPFLWEARHGESRLWLFGTIHVPDERVLTLSPAVRDAFTRADRVVTEIPMDASGQAAMATALLLPEGQHLRTLAGEARFTRLQDRIRAIVEPQSPLAAPMLVAVLDRLKPWAAIAQLVSLEYLKDTLEGRLPLDMRLYEDAGAAGKKVGGLETIDEQASVFDAFSTAEQLALLDEALDQLDAQENAPGDLVTWYVGGDEAKLREALAQSSKDPVLAKKFEEALITRRNERMADRIDDLRRRAPGESMFIAVGTLHLIGPDSVPTLLSRRGYIVTRATRP